MLCSATSAVRRSLSLEELEEESFMVPRGVASVAVCWCGVVCTWWGDDPGELQFSFRAPMVTKLTAMLQNARKTPFMNSVTRYGLVLTFLLPTPAPQRKS